MKCKRSELLNLMVAMGVDTCVGWPAEKFAAKMNEKGIRAFRMGDRDLGDPQLETLFTALDNAKQAGEQIEVESDASPATESGTPDPSVFAPADSATNAESSNETFPLPGANDPEHPEGGSDADPETNDHPPAKPKKGKGGRKKAATKAAKPKKEKKARKAKEPSANGEHKHWNPYGSWDKYKAHFRKNPLAIPEDGILRTTYDELVSAGKGRTPKPVTKKDILGVLVLNYKDRDPKSMEITLNNNVPGRLLRKYGVHVWKQRMDSGEMGYYVVGDGKSPQPKESLPKKAEKSAK